MKLQSVLEMYNTADDYSHEQDKLVPVPRHGAYHGIHTGDLLKKAGFKLDKEETGRLSKEDQTIHADTKVYNLGEQRFYVTGNDKIIDKDGRPVHPLHHEDFMHLVDHMGLLKKEQHPHKAITWADFDMDAVKKAGIKTFVD